MLRGIPNVLVRLVVTQTMSVEPLPGSRRLEHERALSSTPLQHTFYANTTAAGYAIFSDVTLNPTQGGGGVFDGQFSIQDKEATVKFGTMVFDSSTTRNVDVTGPPPSNVRTGDQVTIQARVTTGNFTHRVGVNSVPVILSAKALAAVDFTGIPIIKSTGAYSAAVFVFLFVCLLVVYQRHSHDNNTTTSRQPWLRLLYLYARLLTQPTHPAGTVHQWWPCVYRVCCLHLGERGLQALTPPFCDHTINLWAYHPSVHTLTRFARCM